jgi:Protein of unknown function (DUF3592)
VSHDEQLLRLLATPPPREVAGRLRRAARDQAPPPMVAVIGAVILAFGLFYVWTFFPAHLYRDWELTRSYAATGSIVSAKPTGLRIGDQPVIRYEFSFQPWDGPVKTGVSYTTAWHWRQGDRVNIRYLREDPSVATIEGARMSETNAGSVVVVLFPAIGIALILWFVSARLRIGHLLTHGQVTTAEIIKVEAMGFTWRSKTMHRVTLHCAGWPEPGLCTMLEYKPDLIDFVQRRLKEQKPVVLLFDPERTGRALLAEVL